MCKTFNDVPLSLTCPSRINLTQTNNFIVKSVESVFHRFDSLIACQCNCYLQKILHVDNLTKPLWLCLDSSKTTERNVTGLEIDTVIRTRHERPVHHDTPSTSLFVVISNVVALSTAVLMISGKLIWLTCQIRKCSITVTRSCWLSLKSFQTLHELSCWRTKQASPFSNAFAKLLKTLFLCTDSGLEFTNKLFQRYPRQKRIHFFKGTK